MSTISRKYKCIDCECEINENFIAEIVDKEEKTCICKTCDSYNKYIRS